MNKNDTAKFPVIELGRGLVIIGEGHYKGKPGLVFSAGGTGIIGEASEPNIVVPIENTLSVLTFDNIESLDVLINVASRLRVKMMEKTVFQQPLID